MKTKFVAEKAEAEKRIIENAKKYYLKTNIIFFDENENDLPGFPGMMFKSRALDKNL